MPLICDLWLYLWLPDQKVLFKKIPIDRKICGTLKNSCVKHCTAGQCHTIRTVSIFKTHKCSPIPNLLVNSSFKKCNNILKSGLWELLCKEMRPCLNSCLNTVLENQLVSQTGAPEVLLPDHVRGGKRI